VTTKTPIDIDRTLVADAFADAFRRVVEVAADPTSPSYETELASALDACRAIVRCLTTLAERKVVVGLTDADRTCMRADLTAMCGLGLDAELGLFATVALARVR
jgi:hypothetical protein